MWRLLVWAWCLLLLSPSVAASVVRIEEVGLQGYYSTEPTLTRVRVEVRNALAKPQSIELRFTVRDLVLPYYYELNQKDTFSQTVELGPAQQRELEVPLLISFAQRPVLEVEERDAGGRVLANDRRVLDKPLSDELVAVVCAEQAVCQAAQNQINFSGTSEEQTQKGKLFRFVTVREPGGVGIRGSTHGRAGCSGGAADSETARGARRIPASGRKTGAGGR